MGHAPGLALRLLLSARVSWALVRVLTPLILGLCRLLLRCRNHLEYGALSCGQSAGLYILGVVST